MSAVVVDLGVARYGRDLARGQPAAPAFRVGDTVYDAHGGRGHVVTVNLAIRPPLYLVHMAGRRCWLSEQRLFRERPA